MSMASWRGATRRAPHTPRQRPGVAQCYIALKPCQCVVAAIVIGRRPPAWLRAKVARWLDRGWTVGLVPIHEARARIRRCQHGVRRSAVQEQLAL